MLQRLQQALYRIREKLAYSRAGKLLATRLRDRYFPAARVHWVQQALAECSLRVLERCR